MMAWMYFAICVFDFIIFPILWSVIQVHFHGNIGDAWNPITLQGAGLFHLSLGAILGVSAYGRTKEKTHDYTMEYNRSQSGYVNPENRRIPPQNDNPI